MWASPSASGRRRASGYVVHMTHRYTDNDKLPATDESGSRVMNKPDSTLKRSHAQPPRVPWVKTPKQTRSAETAERLLEASMKILSERGLDGFTISEVCKAADRPSSSLYHLFTDKDTIIRATLERLTEELSLTAAAGLKGEEWESVPLVDILDGYIRWNLRMNRRYAGILEAQRVFAVKHPEEHRRMQGRLKNNTTLLLDLMRPHYSEIGHEDPESACRMVIDTLRAAISRRMALSSPSSNRGRSKKSDDEFASELLRMMSAYLRLRQD